MHSRYLRLIGNIKMVLPICPICQKQYSLQTLPIVLVPCGHGVCESCQDECNRREILECSLCRELVASWTPNYDLRAMVKQEEVDWKEKVTVQAGVRGKEGRSKCECVPAFFFY